MYVKNSKPLNSTRLNIVYELKSSWWMVLFFVGAAALYWGEMKNKNRSVDLILSKMKELQNKKQAAEEQREELLARLNSQNDPAWVEMLLMRKLGVVPEGQVKVYFKSE